MQNDPSDEFVELKSLITLGIPGANIEDARGEKNVIAEIIPTTTPFLHIGQFLGFIWSWSPSQPTHVSLQYTENKDSCTPWDLYRLCQFHGKRG
jgi:hypothetical protein